jgi:excinuclease ABC subunit A
MAHRRHDPDPEEAYNRGEWYGVRGFFKWQESRSYKMHVRVFLSRYRAYTECMDCGGGRLKKEAHNFRIGEHTLADLWRLPVSDLHPLVQSWPLKEGDHAARCCAMKSPAASATWIVRASAI